MKSQRVNLSMYRSLLIYIYHSVHIWVIRPIVAGPRIGLGPLGYEPNVQPLHLPALHIISRGLKSNKKTVSKYSQAPTFLLGLLFFILCSERTQGN